MFEEKKQWRERVYEKVVKYIVMTTPEDISSVFEVIFPYYKNKF